MSLITMSSFKFLLMDNCWYSSTRVWKALSIAKLTEGVSNSDLIELLDVGKLSEQEKECGLAVR